MNESELIIIAPTYYSDHHAFRYFSRSAEIHEIELSNYGFGKPFGSWMETHVFDCIDLLRVVRLSPITHVLFTDASDVIFLRSKQEIVDRYTRLGKPSMLISVEPDGYINAGGWIGEIDVAIEILKYLSGKLDEGSGDPQHRWRWASFNNKIIVTSDEGNVIFSVNQFPTDACILHMAGGYTDPETGKAHTMGPVWKELGYEW